ncbi:hypothetical protein [Botryobacter ruber]|uniref:hypothetical protein n=1 Tax=Botryobacter ruber TaxID=2171629 RepID=UPI000E0A78F9|nr:hypothetical protein [Botryobacter ruber]
MEKLPVFVPIVFSLTTLLALWLLYQATLRSKAVVLVAAVWLVGQSALALSGFYLITDSLPPRMLLLILPPLLLITGLFGSSKGRYFVNRLNPAILTLLHVVRVPVELVLFWLFVRGAVPELMTFEGRNFDILTGLSAPVVYYFGYVKGKLPKYVLVGWNLLCLGLLFNIVIHGILSVPTPFQQFGFEQPNIALLYFPYVALPGFIVPVVLFSHLATLRQLLGQQAATGGRVVQGA